jgi:hypothetical protein
MSCSTSIKNPLQLKIVEPRPVISLVDSRNASGSSRPESKFHVAFGRAFLICSAGWAYILRHRLHRTAQAGAVAGGRRSAMKRHRSPEKRQERLSEGSAGVAAAVGAMPSGLWRRPPLRSTRELILAAPFCRAVRRTVRVYLAENVWPAGLGSGFVLRPKTHSEDGLDMAGENGQSGNLTSMQFATQYKGSLRRNLVFELNLEHHLIVVRNLPV